MSNTTIQPTTLEGTELETYKITSENTARGTVKANVNVRCWKCNGTGRYAWGTCWSCNGSGKQVKNITAYVTQEALDRAKAAQARRAEKKAEKLAAKEAARQRQIDDALGQYADDLATYAKLDRPSEFLRSLVSQLRSKGSLSEKQAACLRPAIDRELERQMEAASAPALKEGRYQITGTVQSVKVADSYYGMTYKMLVDLGNGQRVFGTIPAAIYGSDAGRSYDDLVGCRVAMMAKVERSDRDDSFGFYSRPSKAEVLAA